jgi:hypothetical protein
VNSKLPLLERWKSVYPLTLYYSDYLEACYGSDASSFMINLAYDVDKIIPGLRIKYDLRCIPGLADFLSFWNNYDLKGKYIYRTTSVTLVKDYVYSSSIVPTQRYLSYWSVSPYVSDRYVQLYISNHVARPEDVRVLVAPYDDSICSKVWYDNLAPEYELTADRKPESFGKISYLSELEVRCYEYPTSKVIYSLTIDDFRELMKLLPKL